MNICDLNNDPDDAEDQNLNRIKWTNLKEMCQILSSPDLIASLKRVDLSNNPVFSKSMIQFCLLTKFLQNWSKLEFLNLSYCGLTKISHIKQIMGILNNIETLKEVNFIQFTDDSDLQNDAKDYLNVVAIKLKDNLSIKDFRFFHDEDTQIKACPDIQKELDTNAMNEKTYNNLCKMQRYDHCAQIDVNKIKLCLKFYVRI